VIRLAPLALLALGCASTSVGGDADGEARDPGAPTEVLLDDVTHGVEDVWTDRTLVLLLSADGSERVPLERRREAQVGHFRNMGRLADEGVLLIAGPFAEPRADPAHRGLFVFDLASVREADAVAATDPAVLAGVFATEVIPLSTPSPLGEVIRLEREREEAGGESAVRPYVLAFATDAEAAERALAPLVLDGRVLFRARLGGARRGEGLYCLAAADLPAARALLAGLGGLPDLTLAPWWSSEFVASLPAAR
jgi:uncharacterized protein YciI